MRLRAFGPIAIKKTIVIETSKPVVQDRRSGSLPKSLLVAVS